MSSKNTNGPKIIHERVWYQLQKPCIVVHSNSSTKYTVKHGSNSQCKGNGVFESKISQNVVAEVPAAGYMYNNINWHHDRYQLKYRTMHMWSPEEQGTFLSSKLPRRPIFAIAGQLFGRGSLL